MNNEPSFPFPDENKILKCGNMVPIPGAFSISGSEPVHICFIKSEKLPLKSSYTSIEQIVEKYKAICKTIVRE